MSDYFGDFPAGATIDYKWDTNAASGASIQLATDGTIAVYKNNSTTERASASGITFTENFDGLTGVHHLRISLSDNADAGFYAASNEYQVCVAAAVIDGLNVNGTIFCFSIERTGGILAEIKRRLPDAAANAAGGLASQVHRNGTLPAQTGANPAVGTVNVAVGGIGATDELLGQRAVFFSAAFVIRGTGIITATDNANDRITLNGGTALTFTPTAGDTYALMADPALQGLTAAQIGTAVAANAGIAAALVTIDKFDDMTQTDSTGLWQFTAHGLEEAPAAAGGITIGQLEAAAQVGATASLNIYDAPTFAELDARTDAIQAKTDLLPSDPADQSLIIAATDAVMARLGAPAGASMSADIAATKADTAAILLDTGTDGVVVNATGLATTAVDEIRDAIFNRPFSAATGSLTFDQICKVIISALCAKLAGAATTTVTVRNVADSANVIVATVDADGNRSAVTLTP